MPLEPMASSSGSRRAACATVRCDYPTRFRSRSFSAPRSLGERIEGCKVSGVQGRRYSEPVYEVFTDISVHTADGQTALWIVKRRDTEWVREARSDVERETDLDGLTTRYAPEHPERVAYRISAERTPGCRNGRACA